MFPWGEPIKARVGAVLGVVVAPCRDQVAGMVQGGEQARSGAHRAAESPGRWRGSLPSGRFGCRRYMRGSIQARAPDTPIPPCVGRRLQNVAPRSRPSPSPVFAAEEQANRKARGFQRSRAKRAERASSARVPGNLRCLEGGGWPAPWTPGAQRPSARRADDRYRRDGWWGSQALPVRAPQRSAGSFINS